MARQSPPLPLGPFASLRALPVSEAALSRPASTLTCPFPSLGSSSCSSPCRVACPCFCAFRAVCVHLRCHRWQHRAISCAIEIESSLISPRHRRQSSQTTCTACPSCAPSLFPAPGDVGCGGTLPPNQCRIQMSWNIWTGVAAWPPFSCSVEANHQTPNRCYIRPCSQTAIGGQMQ